MIEEILINVGLRRTRIALVADGRLVELLLPGAGETLVGRIYLGRVSRIEPAVEAAFVELGLPRAGFLPLRGVPALHEGQAVLVQVTREAMGDKGPRLTTDLDLPARRVALAPFRTEAGLSRRIEGTDERARLLAIARALQAEGGNEGDGGGAIILRTSASGASAEELAAEARMLRAEWAEIRDRERQATAPACLHKETDPALAALREHLAPGVARVLIDDVETLLRARDYAAKAAPWALSRIRHHAGPAPLFDRHDLEGQIEAALEPVVPLPSGGAITVQATEALTAIDVDSGRLTDAAGMAETAFRTNLEAAAAIARELRLREIGGLVVIDFIDMSGPGQVEALLKALAAALADDPASTRLSRMSEFGLVELTRRRRREPLAQRLAESCACCGGAGRRPSAATIAERALRAAEREAAARPGHPLRIVAAPEVAADLGGPESELIARLSARIGTRVRLQAEPGRARETFEVGPA